MNNTINVNYMTKTYNSFLNNYETKKSAEKNFVDNVEEKSAARASAASTSGVGVVSTQDMTMEEYKQYIYDKISALSLNPSRMQESISIHISEAGFEAMKNDPEYEKWVLNHLQEEFSCYDPWVSTCGGAYSVLYIGATKDECHGEGWYPGYQGGNGASMYDEKSKGNFWERKAEREKRLKEQYEEMQEKAALARKLQQERINAELIAEKAENIRLMKSWYGESRMTQASAAYEANVLVEQTGSGVFDSVQTGANI